jgi:FkbM family methyltransferase
VSRLRHFARSVRHHPLLRDASILWGAVRPWYKRALATDPRGVEIIVANARVRIPAEFAGGGWEDYEAASMERFVDWIRAHPGGTVLDVGCAIGIYSAVALAHPDTKVIAFDSDLASLAATRRMCGEPGEGRLTLLHGFVLDVPAPAERFDAAALRSSRALEDLAASSTTRYVCVGDPGTEALARMSIDALWAGRPILGPTLLKCDIEGAELMALRGAAGFLARRPDLLLSVHPRELEAAGHSSEDVRRLLADAGYAAECFAIDHEEHWWCHGDR